MITLVLGGTRSGKSLLAERLLAAEAGTVAGATPARVPTYLASASPAVGDEDHAARIRAHRERRPTSWRTLERTGPDLVTALTEAPGVVLLDSLGSWLAGHRDFAADTQTLLAALVAREQATVVVSEEVGLSVHPQHAVGRHYVDALGTLNQAVARVAERVLLVVAGRVMELPAGDPVADVALLRHPGRGAP